MVKANTSEAYTFYTTADDGVRLYVNGQLLIDDWQDQGATTRSGSINMLAGQWYQIVVQYYNNQGGTASSWNGPAQCGEGSDPCTQFTHYNQAPTNTLPAAADTIQNTSLTFSDYVSVPVEGSSFESPNVHGGDYRYGGSDSGWTFTDWGTVNNSSSAAALCPTTAASATATLWMA